MRRPRIHWLEAAALLLPTLAFIAVLDRGDSNGVGLFRQPQNDLLGVMLIGLVVNGLTVYIHAFRLIPDMLVRGQVGRYLVALSALSGAALVLKTAAHRLLIVLTEPTLAHLSWTDLARENLTPLAVFLVLSASYGLARVGVLAQHAPATDADRTAPEGTLDFKSGRKIHRLRADDLLYLEGKGNYVRVVARDRSVLVYTTLRAEEERLCSGPDFARIHRSFIVCLRNVEAADPAAVQIGGRRLPVSRSYGPAFARKLGLER